MVHSSISLLGLAISHYLEQAQTEAKVIVVGDYGVGKTSFIKGHINGFLAKKFLSEYGCHVVPMLFSTNKNSWNLQVKLFPIKFIRNQCFWGKNIVVEICAVGMGLARTRSFRGIEALIFVRQHVCATKMQFLCSV
jgi:hypothetical protein